jgi:hypothetical protein
MYRLDFFHGLQAVVGYRYKLHIILKTNVIAKRITQFLVIVRDHDTYLSFHASAPPAETS